MIFALCSVNVMFSYLKYNDQFYLVHFNMGAEC